MTGGTARLIAPTMALLVVLSGCTLPLGQQQGPGAKYEDYLTGGGTLLVEMDHAPGTRPHQQAIDGFKQQLSRITGKTVQVQVSQDLPAGGGTYTADDLQALHEAHQDHQDNGNTVVMHALIVDGRIQNDRVAGLAFDSDAFALAMRTIESGTCSNGALVCADGSPRQKYAVRSVAIHEAGHLFGLVGITLPMVQDHEDGEHEGHSTNPRSVMYWEVEMASRFNNILFEDGEQIPWRFDEQDMADAQALREDS